MRRGRAPASSALGLPPRRPPRSRAALVPRARAATPPREGDDATLRADAQHGVVARQPCAHERRFSSRRRERQIRASAAGIDGRRIDRQLRRGHGHRVAANLWCRCCVRRFWSCAASATRRSRCTTKCMPSAAAGRAARAWKAASVPTSHGAAGASAAATRRSRKRATPMARSAKRCDVDDRALRAWPARAGVRRARRCRHSVAPAAHAGRRRSGGTSREQAAGCVARCDAARAEGCAA